MNEYEWAMSEDPEQMIKTLLTSDFRITNRHVHMFCCALNDKHACYLAADTWFRSFLHQQQSVISANWPETADVLRELFDYPLRKRTKDIFISSDALSIARSVYEDRSPGEKLDSEKLLILSDALEESGCEDPVLLGHLRGHHRSSLGIYCGKPISSHIYGCWVMEYVLGYNNHD